ncbi:MAG: Ribosomal RNA small subunit methyltransferase A [Bacteroidota bacterium]|nr:MAG: Ribosomal RNA small subunit methyltransferase A [Bacteroidota bacterium]
MSVRPKKYLGQHFLNDQNIAQNIAGTLSGNGYDDVLEIGPGMGVLTQYLLPKPFTTSVIEIDSESVDYLKSHFTALENRIIEGDFLKLLLSDYFKGQVAVIGNFPYNISSQILFRIIEQRHLVPEFSGMFQKEVAERICEKPGTKAYGILSVLAQAFYDAQYLFNVSRFVFNPPPKVASGVIRLTRKQDFTLPCSDKLFFRVVKTAFQQRRKTLRNSLKSFGLSASLKEDSIFDERPERLGVSEFIELTQKIADDTLSTQ